MTTRSGSVTRPPRTAPAARTAIRQWGNGAAVRLPAALLRAAGLRLDMEVEIRAEAGRLVIEPLPRRYTLAVLIAQCDPGAPLTEEDRTWVLDAPAGREPL